MLCMRFMSFLLALVFLLSGLEAAKIPAPAFSFSLVPKKIIVQKGHREIEMSLVLLCQFHQPGVELKARRKHGKTHLTYSKPFKKFIKSINLRRKDFKPFASYLKAQVKHAEEHPDPYIIILDAYLKTGTAPQFTIDLRNK